MVERSRRDFLLSCVQLGAIAAVGEPNPDFADIHKIDVHSHVFEDMPALADMMRKNNIRIINVCNRGSEPELLKTQDEAAQKLFRKYGGSLFPFASSFDLTRRNEPDYAEHVIAWLQRNFRAGAIMVKIWKEVGMGLKTPDGKFMMPDDPIFDPIYEYIASQNRPLLAHLADPIAAWMPLDPDNVHYGYYSRNPEWHFYGKKGYPLYEELIAARDRVLERHIDLVVIGAHMGSLSHDIDEVTRRLDRYPNFYVECSARTADLSRQSPHEVRSFFQKYSDRILYGLDRTRRPNSGDSSESFVRDMERRYRLDYQYYAGSEPLEYRGKRVEALSLPQEILRRFYHGNAQRLMPALGGL